MLDHPHAGAGMVFQADRAVCRDQIVNPAGIDRRAGAVDAAEPDAGALSRRAAASGRPGAAVETDTSAADRVTKRPLLPHQETSGPHRFGFRRALPPAACPRPEDGAAVPPAEQAGENSSARHPCAEGGGREQVTCSYGLLRFPAQVAH